MTDDKIKTVEPENDPEYVGAHSALSASLCEKQTGDAPREIEQCGEPATHTVVMFHAGDLYERAMCDDCGEPQDVDSYERIWSGDPNMTDDNAVIQHEMTVETVEIREKDIELKDRSLVGTNARTLERQTQEYVCSCGERFEMGRDARNHLVEVRDD